MRASTITIIALAALSGADASRVKVHEAAPKGSELVTCHAVGQFKGEGMSATWGLPKNRCMAECGPTAGGEFTYTRAFTSSFTVSFDKKCQCSDGTKVVATFKAHNKAQVTECNEGTSDAIHAMCWEMYMRGRGTRFVTAGALSVPRYTVPFSPADFVVNRGCQDPCTDNKCNTVTMPTSLEGMEAKDKAKVGFAIKQVMDGNKADVSDALVELIAVLPPADLNAAEFAAIDKDGDGQLSVDELSAFFTAFTPTQIAEFVKVADENNNGDIDPEEFSAFKQAMRDFNPAVDLATGDSLSFLIDDDDEVVELKPQWKVTTVTCMKGGEAAPGECEGTEEEAITHFDMNCRVPKEALIDYQ